MEYKENQIITENEQPNCSVWCNNNGEYHIEKINDNLVIKKNTFTQQEQTQQKIYELKKKLTETDYKAIKYAEGELSEIEYAETKAKRKQWREEITKLGG